MFIALVAVLAPAAHAVPPGRGQELSDRAFSRIKGLRAPLTLPTYDAALMAAAIFHETNRVRREAGLPAFRPMRKLDEAADLQAGIGAVLPGVDHHNPLPGLGDVADRVHSVGLEYAMVAENIALTPTLDATGLGEELRFEGNGAGRRFFDAKSGRPLVPLDYGAFAAVVVRQWMNSPEHRANILNPQLHYLGCSACWRREFSGLDALYSVQVFMTP
ncbi:MAG TPA: CAP domain-containing protein [Lacunisphaera sp.]|nr:CAP domain-containing protein [Lacunisphaera sp.]